MGYQLTLTDTLLLSLGEDRPPPRPSDWEVGRLVLAPEHRSDVGALRHCLHLTLAHIRAHAEVGDLYASCTHVLARLYRRFGFDAIARDVPLAGTDKRYTLIRGSAPAVAASLLPVTDAGRPQ